MDLKRLIATGALLLTSLIPKSAGSYASKSADGTDSIHPLISSQLSAFLTSNSLLPEEVTFNLGKVKQGSVNEDLPPGALDYLRSFHHFIHWNTGKGLWGVLPSSLEWALSPDLQSATTFNFNALPAPVAKYFTGLLGQTSLDLLLGGDHSWPRVIEDYQNGEVSTNFGHIFHLISDATVPAHVRLDAHWGEAPFLEKLLENYYSEGAALWPTDAFEVWTDEHKFEIMNLLTPKAENVPSPESLSELFKDLAHFTGSNFYSDNGVDGTVAGLTEVMEGNKKYFVKEVEGKKVHVLRQGLLTQFPDTTCLQDMWKVLGTKSLEYGAAALNILAKEQPVEPPECTNECDYGQTSCKDNNVMTCTNNDLDDCREWAPSLYCGEGQVCKDGDCVEEEPECISFSSKTCSGEDVHWQDSCGNLESFIKTCMGDFYCSNGDCVTEPPTCEDECDTYGEKTCSDNQNVVKCNYNNEGCLEWKFAEYCSEQGDQKCENGACVPSCISECDSINFAACISKSNPNQGWDEECAIGGINPCDPKYDILKWKECDFDYDDDLCLEWGPINTCE